MAYESGSDIVFEDPPFIIVQAGQRKFEIYQRISENDWKFLGSSNDVEHALSLLAKAGSDEAGIFRDFLQNKF